MVLAQNSLELVSRCYDSLQGLVEREELKKSFVSYVFEIYQEEVIAHYDIETFHDHLEQIQLSNCRKDFDHAVDQWLLQECGTDHRQTGFHDMLFTLIRETIVKYRPTSRAELLQEVTRMLTAPDGYMSRWKMQSNGSYRSYFQYLMKLGIRSYSDIECIVDMWLIEYPNSFDKTQQQLFAQPIRRGRPNNAELSQLLEKAGEWKATLTPLEKERIRKIYYYHRKNMTIPDMLEKFKRYVCAKLQQLVEETDLLAN